MGLYSIDNDNNNDDMPPSFSDQNIHKRMMVIVSLHINEIERVKLLVVIKKFIN